MESAKAAVKNISRNLYARYANRLKRWLLKQARNMLWRADEWIRVREQAMRDEAEKPERLAEVDPIASALRERSHRRERSARGVSGAGAGRPASQNRLPRLKYQHGEFVRTERAN